MSVPSNQNHTATIWIEPLGLWVAKDAICRLSSSCLTFASNNEAIEKSPYKRSTARQHTAETDADRLRHARLGVCIRLRRCPADSDPLLRAVAGFAVMGAADCSLLRRPVASDAIPARASYFAGAAPIRCPLLPAHRRVLGSDNGRARERLCWFRPACDAHLPRHPGEHL